MDAIQRSALRMVLATALFIGCVERALAADIDYIEVPGVQAIMAPAVPSAGEIARFPAVFTFPKSFEIRHTDYGVLAATTADLDLVVDKKDKSITREGIFTIEPSAAVGYDADKDTFGGIADAQHVQKLVDAGLVNVYARRVMPATRATLEISATRALERIRVVYVALGARGGVLRIAYTHAQPERETDAKNWASFVSGLAR